MGREGGYYIGVSVRCDLGREGVTMLGFLLGVILLAQMQAMEDHYQNLCAVVTSRAILSLGVACFKWSNSGFSKTVPLETRVFNVWLLTQQPFVTDPSSAQFLILHGFDFNNNTTVARDLASSNTHALY